jgi:hypothetical protein
MYPLRNPENSVICIMAVTLYVIIRRINPSEEILLSTLFLRVYLTVVPRRSVYH